MVVLSASNDDLFLLSFTSYSNLIQLASLVSYQLLYSWSTRLFSTMSNAVGDTPYTPT